MVQQPDRADDSSQMTSILLYREQKQNLEAAANDNSNTIVVLIRRQRYQNFS